MAPEAWLVILILVGVTLPLTIAAVRSRPTSDRVPAFAAWGIGVAAIAWLAASYAPPLRARTPVTDRPIEVAHEGYVSSRACKACHPEQYGSWHRSYHRTMTQSASTDTVLGPIDGTVVSARGHAFVLERRGKEVWVEMDDVEWDAGPPGLDTGTSSAEGLAPGPQERTPQPAGRAPRVWRQIVQTTGSHSEQFYWVSAGESRKLSLLPIMYRLLEEQRWTSLDGCCISEPEAQQQLESGRWNRVCNRCHSTHALPGIDVTEGTMDTRVAELGIACEACHGPGDEHAQANRNPRERYVRHLADADAGSIVNPSKLAKERSAEVCGQCHGVNGFHDEASREEWRESGFPYRPGDVLAETRLLERAGEDRFWSDGMMRVSGREYNGLVRTPCFENGEMTCLSCHSMHKTADDRRSLDEWADDQLKPGMDGDLACTQCHDQYSGAEAAAAHTHHAAGSSGSACMNCHMPYTTYGLLKGIRSHEVTSPSAQESIETGRPNACNQCHLDRTLAFTAEHLERWYGIATPALNDEQRSIAAAVLWAVKGDAGQRALMAWSMGWEEARKVAGTDWMIPYLALLMRDPYRAVRYIAYRSIELHPEASKLAEKDPTAPPEEQIERTAPVFQAWLARGRKSSPALLITRTGDLDRQVFERLLSQRDHRPVVLNE